MDPASSPPPSREPLLSELRVLLGVSAFFLFLTLVGWWQLLSGFAPFNRVLGGLISDSAVAGIYVVYGSIAATVLSVVFAVLALRRDRGLRVRSRLLLTVALVLWTAMGLIIQTGVRYAHQHPYWPPEYDKPIAGPWPVWETDPLRLGATRWLRDAWPILPDYPPPAWYERALPFIGVMGLAAAVYFFSLPLGWAITRRPAQLSRLP
ncbi:hypothetical protein BH09VER1_BH09VER1_45930 [soil metagenome]